MPLLDESFRPIPEKREPTETACNDLLKHCEEVKRRAATDPLVRWDAMQEFMAWAASQSTAPRMTPAACKAKERRLLAGMAEMFEKKAAED